MTGMAVEEPLDRGAKNDWAHCLPLRGRDRDRDRYGRCTGGLLGPGVM